MIFKWFNVVKVYHKLLYNCYCLIVIPSSWKFEHVQTMNKSVRHEPFLDTMFICFLYWCVWYSKHICFVLYLVNILVVFFSLMLLCSFLVLTYPDIYINYRFSDRFEVVHCFNLLFIEFASRRHDERNMFSARQFSCTFASLCVLKSHLSYIWS